MRLVEVTSWICFVLAAVCLGMAMAYENAVFVGSAVAVAATGVLFHGMAAIIGHLEALRRLPAAADSDTIDAPVAADPARPASSLADLEANLARIRARQT